MNSSTIAGIIFIFIFIILPLAIILPIVLVSSTSSNKNKVNSQRIQKPLIIKEKQYVNYTYERPKLLPYKQKPILTQNEYNFYIYLKRFADYNNLHILSKIRLADIIEPLPNLTKSEWYSAFSKIQAKHVDFALATKSNLKILCLIELDDNSHNNRERINRDKFVDEIYDTVKIPIIHTKIFDKNTETQICNILNFTQRT